MAYADQTLSTRKIVSLSLVVLLHVLLGYAFISGLAFNVIKNVSEDLKTFDVEDEPPPPPDKPPPPPEVPKQIEPPPVVTPPPVVQTQSVNAPVIQVVPVAPPPPPSRPVISQAAGARGDPAQWFTNDDYPPSALRDGREGRTVIAYDINTQGRVENCRVTASSGSSDLDDTACKLMLRRGRFTPAKDTAGQPIRSTGTRPVRWVVPK